MITICWLADALIRVIGLGSGFFVYRTWQRRRGVASEIRAHGNFTEYVPMMILLAFLELSDISELKLHLLGGAFSLGRVMHGVCFGFMRSNMLGLL